MDLTGYDKLLPRQADRLRPARGRDLPQSLEAIKDLPKPQLQPAKK